MAVTLNSSQVQQNFGAVLDRATLGDDVVIERYGKPRAAIVAYERYQRLTDAEREQAREDLTSLTAAPRPAQVGETAAVYQVGGQFLAQEPASTASAGAIPVAYRYIVRTPGICAGRPIVRGTRVPVRAIVGYHKLGMSADEILTGLPHLTPAQVHEALSYYYDHMDEIERDIQENQLAHLIERYGLQVAADGRITFAG
jgi:uncharacterized protein (DUF433 family)/antitoxin (DNA-binding transcriptional repressor) of toxin-antitoxin stability system